MNSTRPTVPEVIVRGPGEPVAAIVGGIHGDEPSGVRAIRRLVAAEEQGDLAFDRGIKFIVANPPALAAETRYLDVDMNRSFPGNPDGTNEERLAATVCKHVKDVPTLALHSTQSQDEPFGFVSPEDKTALDLALHLPIPHLVLSIGQDVGALSTCGSVVTVEVGRQGTDRAADNAEALSRAFLRAVDVVDGAQPPATPEIFRVGEEIEKPDGGEYDVHVENFSRVETGTPFATVDGETLIATEEFYPVLMSANGYESIFGFTATRVAGTPSDAGIREGST